jgi:hypothetical protein
VQQLNSNPKELIKFVVTLDTKDKRIQRFFRVHQNNTCDEFITQVKNLFNISNINGFNLNPLGSEDIGVNDIKNFSSVSQFAYKYGTIFRLQSIGNKSIDSLKIDSHKTTPSKSSAPQVQEEELLKKFKRILKMSNRIKRNDIAKILGIPEDDIIMKLFDWADKFPFKIDGDFVVVEDINAFVNAIDKQFEDWEGKESSKDGKIL